MFLRSRLLIILIAALVISLLAGVWTSYRTQVELRDASLNRFKDSAVRESVSIKHFFIERRHDLEDMEAGREIRTYFESKGLGMSPKYGLWASLVEISELFSRVCQQKKLHGKRIYRQIAFVDMQGHILADNNGIGKDSLVRISIPPSSSASGDVNIYVENDGKDIVLTRSFMFKGEMVGRIVAWLNVQHIVSAFMDHFREAEDSEFEMLIYKQNDLLLPLQEAPPAFVEMLAKGNGVTSGDIYSIQHTQKSGVQETYLVVFVPISGTPLWLVDFVPEKDVLGRVSPMQFIFVVILLVFLFVGGGIYVLGVTSRNMVLKLQVVESARMASNIAEKKKQLEDEISARTQAEEELHKVNDELEQRVADRTKDLQERTDALSREVQERKEAEETIRIVYNKAYNAIVIHDVEGHILEVNERMLTLYGVDREEALRLSISEDMSGSEAPVGTLEEKWRQVLNGEDLVFDWICKRPKDGSLFDVEIALSRIDLKGQGVILANIHDISEHRKIQVQQEEHQEFLNTIFEGLGAAIFVFDPSQGVMVDCNSVGENLLSLSREEILDQSFQSKFYFKTDLEKDLLCPDEYEQGTYEEGALLMPDGRSIPVSRHLFEVYIGGQSHLVEVVSDITARKVLERKLNIAQKLESIGQLASGIAHEINTPIQYVGDSVRFVKDVFGDTCDLLELYRDALSESGECPAKEKWMERIEEFEDEVDMEFVLEETPKACDRALEGAERVASIVLAMKNFSHPGEEKPQAVDINKCIMNTVIVSRNEWKYVSDLTTDLSPELPLIHGFPGGINQVLLNVIVNAAHAIGEVVQGDERGQILVTTSYSHPYVEIRVKDTGCGISKENLMKIYDPFFTTKEVGKGTGQGLAIVHDIVVEKHGGTVDIESEVGIGTTFIVRLPVNFGDETVPV